MSAIEGTRSQRPCLQVWRPTNATLVHVMKKAAAYALLYGSVSSVFAVLFFLANLVALHRDLPYRTGDNGLLGLQPAISIRPSPDSLTSLIRYKAGVPSTSAMYVGDLFSFVSSYERHTQYSRLSDCSMQHSYADHPKYSCKFNLDIDQGKCNVKMQYGFDAVNPCIAVKLNRIVGWVPSFTQQNGSRGPGLPTVKIKCDGVTQSDREQFENVCYFDEEAPLRSQNSPQESQSDGCSLDYGQIRNYYFPYKKQQSYQTPFVWAKFIKVKRHVVVMIQCWAIVDNITVDLERGVGSLRFELLVD